MLHFMILALLLMGKDEVQTQTTTLNGKYLTAVFKTQIIVELNCYYKTTIIFV